MCGPHQREVQRVTRERLVRAEQSNRPGWNAITDASIRPERPILPFGLASKIRAHTGKPGPELLRLLAQAQEQFSGQPEEFYAAIGEVISRSSWGIALASSWLRWLGCSPGTASASCA